MDVQDHLKYLHGATLRIGESLNAEQALLALCQTAIPRLADLASVYLLADDEAARPGQAGDGLMRQVAAEDGQIHRVNSAGDGLIHEVAAGDRLMRQVAAEEGQIHRVNSAGDGLIHKGAAEDGQTHRLSSAGDGLMHQVNSAGDDRIAPLLGKVPLRELGGPFAEVMSTGRPAGVRPGVCPGPPLHGRSGFLLVLPLRFEGRVQGFTLLLREAQRGPFDDTDRLMASLIVDQAALNVHNAHLYQREARIADTLRRGMLPKGPPKVPGVEIAHRYLPSNPATQVGGDWFDAIPLPGARVALMIGDVMGHGVQSAATMGQLRTAARTLASLDLPPDQALRHLNEVARQLDSGHLATCVYCVYDPVVRRCTIANAGHIPPVLVQPDGSSEIIDLPPGGPIGLGEVSTVVFESVEFSAPDGGLIVFCTDGLVESRTRDLDQGLTMLRESLRTPADGLDALCDHVLQAMNSKERQDDVALLTARFGGIPSENVARWIMRPHPKTASRVRGLIRTTLEAWELADRSDDAELLATELVSNAIRYASRPIEIRLMRTDALLCEVTDDDHRLPVLREPNEDDEGGRGLLLVDRLARHWGASRTTSGKAVWFELALGIEHPSSASPS